MKLSNVRLIMFREIRDQARDRRTLFMIAVLPILLYPLLGVMMLQITQFFTQEPSKILIANAAEVDSGPKLFENNQFASDLLDDLRQLGHPMGDEDESSLFAITYEGEATEGGAPDREEIEKRIRAGEFDAALYFPPDFGSRLNAYQVELLNGGRPVGDLPSPELIYTTADDGSVAAMSKIRSILDRWEERVVQSRLEASGIPRSVIQPFNISHDDVAEETGFKNAAMWSRMLPVLLLLWALTGAFYPAVDLCAGEKERGTLETLLSSPARRSEIVLGKLLSVMMFSMGTAILNLGSLGITGLFVVQQFPQIAAPPLLSPLWLLIALVPMSALFSALCVALAVLARSTKEGQYYLVPMMTVAMPLAIAAVSPGIELTLGTALVPVTNVALVLRELIVGDYISALTYLPIVVLVTLGCCILAIRWAVDQFNSEKVLFRESERLDLKVLLRDTFMRRRAMPTVGMALIFGIFILTIRLVLGFMGGKLVGDSTGTMLLVKMVLIPQILAMLLPLILFLFLIKNRSQTLLLHRRPPFFGTIIAILLAVMLNPAVRWFGILIMKLYPPSTAGAEKIQQIFELMMSLPLWQLLVLFALVPAILEELVFRGFVLSGLRQSGRRWQAVIITALFFGFTHLTLQQSLNAVVLGVLLGFIAVKTGSIVPCIAYHFVHNGLSVGVSYLQRLGVFENPSLAWLVEGKGDNMMFTVPVAVGGAMLGLLLLLILAMIPTRPTSKERLQERIDRGYVDPNDEVIRKVRSIGVECNGSK